MCEEERMWRKGAGEGGREASWLRGCRKFICFQRDHRGTFVTGAERGKEVYFKLFCTHWRRGTFWKATIT